METRASQLGNRVTYSQSGSETHPNGQLTREPIAVIGIGCRFPGARGPEAFWRLLRDGVDAITEIPGDRFDVDAVYDPRPGIPGKINTRYGGFLQDVDKFDPYFFGISPREAAAMDPQQRLLLEVAWEALEDAGQVTEKLAGGQTGVFVGMCTNDYGNLLQDPADIDIYFSGGNALSVLSGRLSYVLGVQGPSVTLDTACSTSLVAVHLACQSLWSGESRLALAGGTNLILLPMPYMGFSRAGMLAADGRCKFGDARADGFIRSDGVGLVVLKPLSQAQADGDPIYAVIRGIGVNNDGRSGGLLMTPSRPGQEEVLREAYRNAGLSPGQVHYVEAHGTGTSVGDPIELQALGTVLSEDRPKDRPCVVGSVKTNIGHTEGAAGVAGLIKVALALKHREIPPSLHFQEPNPDIPWEELPVVVQRELGPWPVVDSEPARAGVSSFGISGTNAHVVLEEAPQVLPTDDDEETSIPETKAQLLPLSAHSLEALEDMARAYQTFLSAENGVPSLPDISYTASARRIHHDHRLAVVGHSRRELAEHLVAFLEDELRLGMSSGRRIPGRQPKTVFVFPGQGSQWVGMGRELLEQELVFREALERCDQAMRAHVEWSLLEELTADEAQSRLDEVDVIQPAIFAVQVALAALWRSWGVEPDAVVGQSMGEVAAAHVAGALSLEDAARVICRRSRLVKSTVSGEGGMAVVGLALEEARRAVADYEDRVSVAVSSSPTSTVLSGEIAALEEVLDQLEQQDIFCRWIKVDYASHSPQMEPLRPELLRILEGLQPRPASVPIYSTVTGEVSDGQEFDATYWARNIREPVLLLRAVERLLDDDHNIFLEVSPHPILTSAIQQGLHHFGREGTVLPSLRTGEEERVAMLGSLGALYTVGYPVDWSKLYPSGGQCVRLPAYPFQRERFWMETQATGDGRTRGQFVGRRNGKGHLLGQYLKSAADSGTHFWEMELDTRLFHYLNDHRVQGVMVLPAAAYVEMALAAAEEAFGAGPHGVENMTFKKALFLPESGVRTIQLVISPDMPGTASFQLFSLQADGADEQPASPTLHATATIRIGQAGLTDAVPEHESPEEVQARCQEVVSGADFYQFAGERGLEYGPSFQGVDQVWRRDGEAIGRLRLPETIVAEADAYQIHPALLDASFQVSLGTQPNDAERATYLPVSLGSLRLYDRPSPESGLWAHAIQEPDAETNGDLLKGDVFLLDDDGHLVLEARGVDAQRIDQDVEGGISEDLDDWLYEIQWQPKPRPEEQPASEQTELTSPGSWLIFVDSDGVGKALAERLIAQGERCVLVNPDEGFRRTYKRADREYFRINPERPEDMRELLEAAFGSGQPACRGVIHLWSLDNPPPEEMTAASLETAQALGSFSVLHLVQALVEAGWIESPKLWLVTRGAQAVETEVESVSIAQSPVWGLGKVISLEHPEFQCTKVDLSASSTPKEIQSLFEELWTGDQEDQVALRGDERHVPRLVRYSPEEALEEKRSVSPEDQPFRVELSTPGILDNLTLREATRQKPGPGEVEIQVCAAGLNFRDVIMALGMVPGLQDGSIPIGLECTGKISALGEGVEEFELGDEVVAVAPYSFATHTITNTQLVARKPTHLSFEEAATTPITFLTAYYALQYLGKIRQGERVLIHAASGGVGLAAVQIAQWVGAEIFATAGSPEKREFLRSLGIKHIMDSRSLDFAEEVMEITNGEGVDIVLNSLAGEAIPKGLSILRSEGRFLELGKRDILQNSQLGLRPFLKGLSFYAIDLEQMFRARPTLPGTLFREIVEHFEDGIFEPLPLRVFPISEVEAAYRYMAQAKHIGKIVLSLQEDEVLVAPSKEPVKFRSDGTYLITGGLGGLGLAVAQWMVEQGARHLALMGRSGASSAAKREAVEALERAGARVTVVKADVSQEQQVADALAEVSQSMPPLKGVIHGAGVLDDGILLQLNRERFKTVMVPKVNGAWNLHRLTLDEELDYFVLFSSAASVLGSPGQGNYVAANAFLDALAHHRRALGLPAVTINWGAWAEVGLAARPDRTEHLTRQGVVAFTPAQGVQLLARMLQHDDLVQVMGVAMDWSQLLGAYTPPLLSQLAEEVVSGSPAESVSRKAGLMREKLLSVEPPARQELLEEFLREQMAKILKSSPSKVDMHQPLDKLGIDSLMAVELKNRVETDLEVNIPVTALLQGPTLAQLGSILLDQLTTRSSTSTESAPPLIRQETEEKLLANVDQLSDEEVDSLLSEMLDGDMDEAELMGEIQHADGVTR